MPSRITPREIRQWYTPLDACPEGKFIHTSGRIVAAEITANSLVALLSLISATFRTNSPALQEVK